jgi:DNA-binding transcriptional MerR regulator
MLKIGDFARLGQVSVRMLRNYDELGLLVPAHVDPWTNYRSYTAGQLARLNRIVALKGLGFSLDAVGRLLDEDLTVEQLRGMLVLRRAELADELRSTTGRLAAVEARLRLIEGEQSMSEREFVVKALPAMRVAERSFAVSAPEEIGPRVGPLFGEVYGAIRAAGAEPGLGLSYYVVGAEGMECHAGFGYGGEPASGFDLVELPAVAEAVTQVHLGSMATIGESWQAFGAWLEEHGAEPAGPSREVYLEAPMDDEDAWVTELQLPFVRRS